MAPGTLAVNEYVQNTGMSERGIQTHSGSFRSRLPTCQAPGCSGAQPALSSYCSQDLTSQVHSLRLFRERGHWGPRETMNMRGLPARVRAEPPTRVCSTGGSACDRDRSCQSQQRRWRLRAAASISHVLPLGWGPSLDPHRGSVRQGHFCRSLTGDRTQAWRMKAAGPRPLSQHGQGQAEPGEGDLGYAHLCVCSSTF